VPAFPEQASLQGSATADVCILGAGITGLSTAIVVIGVVVMRMLPSSSLCAPPARDDAAYQVVREYWPEFQEELDRHGKMLPA